jgi:PAS domain S-box-containing protein
MMISNERLLNYDGLAELLLKELADVGVFFMDIDRQIKSWSPGIERILGYSEEEFIGRDGNALFTPEDRESKLNDAEFEQARVHGRAPDMRWHMKKDGSRIFVDGVLSGTFDAAKTHVGYTKMMRCVKPNGVGDNMLSAILEHTHDIIFLKDRQGRFTYINPETERMLGRKEEDILGRTLEEFFPPHLSRAIREDDTKVMEDGLDHSPARNIEERMLTKERGERTFLSGKAPWHDRHGSVIGVVCISQDISDRKDLEEDRERLLRELRRSNEDLAQFSYVVSHDLQAPLRMVKSYTQLLARRYQGNGDETADQFVSVINNGADGMEQLIQALLRYAHAGDEALSRTEVRVDAILEGARSNLEPVIDECSAELVQEPLPIVIADPVQMLQLFQNIIGNALKYCRPGVPPRIHVSATREGEVYRFAIRDNGIGIDSKNFERIFAPLKRLHGQEIPGTGIGLAVCKRIVERHSGRIWLTSKPGEGSTFHFTLPAHR